jgi:hypothetical protein
MSIPRPPVYSHDPEVEHEARKTAAVPSYNVARTIPPPSSRRKNSQYNDELLPSEDIAPDINRFSVASPWSAKATKSRIPRIPNLQSPSSHGRNHVENGVRFSKIPRRPIDGHNVPNTRRQVIVNPMSAESGISMSKEQRKQKHELQPLQVRVSEHEEEKVVEEKNELTKNNLRKANDEEHFSDKKSRRPSQYPPSAPPIDEQEYEPYSGLDWRAQICQITQISYNASDSQILAALQALLYTLSRSRKDDVKAKYPERGFLYSVSCRREKSKLYFLDQPYRVNQFAGHNHVSGRIPLNLPLHVERNRQNSFLVIENYECCQYGSSMASADSEPTAVVARYSSLVLSKEQCSTFTELCSLGALDQSLVPEFVVDIELEGPYFWIYHGRKAIEEAKPNLEPKSQLYIDLFMSHVSSEIGREYVEVDKQIAAGMISYKYIRYLWVRIRQRQS